VLLLAGLMTRDTAVAGTSSTELLGPGDVILSAAATPGVLVPTRPSCTVLQPTRLAVLDESLTQPIARWPGLGALLVQRAARLAERLAVAGAVSHLTRVDARVLTMLWAIAERWGRVTSDGLLVPLPLTHRTLARMVGARRPTVTSAVSDLTRRGLIARRADGAWELHGTPPDLLREAQPQPRPAAPAGA
jgi:CRP-like cAMP-binding protein